MKKLSTKTRIALRIVLIVLISVVIGVTVYQFNVRNLVGDEMPMPLGFGVGVVVSGSMEPHLSVDDMIVVVEIDPEDLTPADPEHGIMGDWVVFQSKGVLVVHELISISPDGKTVVTQGTANNTPDDPMGIEQIKGRVAFHIDGAGKAVDFVKSPIGTALILVLAAALLMLSYKSETKSDNAALDEIRREIERLKAEQGIAQQEEQGSAQNGAQGPESTNADENPNSTPDGESRDS